MQRALPVLASQTFAGNTLVRGIAGRKLQQILSDPSGALFTLVANQRVAVGGGSSGNSGGGALWWLSMEGLAGLDLSYSRGEHLELGGEIQAPVYFLGQDKERDTPRLAVDVAAAPASWAEERGVQLRVREPGSLEAWLPCCNGQQAGRARASAASLGPFFAELGTCCPSSAGPPLPHAGAARSRPGSGGPRHGSLAVAPGAPFI